MNLSIFGLLLCYLAYTIAYNSEVQSPNSNIRIRFANTDDSFSYSIVRDNAIIQQVELDSSFGNNPQILHNERGFDLLGHGSEVHFLIEDVSPSFTLITVTRSATIGLIIKDCWNLESATKSWYGGPQQKLQYWPIDKLTFSNYSYVTKEADNCAIAERYWLNSEGVFIYIDIETPLFLDQNINGNNLCFIAKKELPYDTHTSRFTFNSYIGVGNNAKQAHMEAVNRFLKKPTGYPDERMVKHPIWSTWARYKVNINQTIVLQLADEILKNRFNNSQLEIDDDWEVCYGSLTFRTSKFPNIRNLTDTLRQRGFRVTLWIHPFINKGCEPWYTEAKSKRYFVTDHKNNTDTQWWQSPTNGAGLLDFTKPVVSKWFNDRLRQLQQSAGIDSFKFDAGESSWAPSDPFLNATPALHPNAITTDYVNTVAAFGSLIEVRSGKKNQNLPIFLRMLDKDSEWFWNNGLPTLITTLLQLNMVGYPFVLPDMIGGNGYNNHPPNKEMFIRWLQANVFMPSLQFSYVPWDYDNETIEISRHFTDLHANYAEYIINRFQLAVITGEPVNPPMWWAHPEDRIAQQIYDQFLLGEDIIVAPIIEEGKTTRHIYLLRGRWEDKNTGLIHTGPKWLMDYPAPINVLPYFVRAY